MESGESTPSQGTTALLTNAAYFRGSPRRASKHCMLNYARAIRRTGEQTALGCWGCARFPCCDPTRLKTCTAHFWLPRDYRTALAGPVIYPSPGAQRGARRIGQHDKTYSVACTFSVWRVWARVSKNLVRVKKTTMCVKIFVCVNLKKKFFFSVSHTRLEKGRWCNHTPVWEGRSEITRKDAEI